MDAIVVGSIKSFNPKKGFGFIGSEEAGGDIYFKSQALPQELRDGFFDENFIQLVGRNVQASARTTPDGKLQATSITLLAQDPLDQLVGTVKNFSDKAGYGFIVSSSVEGDVFFKLKYVPQELGGSGVRGQAVRFCLHTTEDGKPQANKVAFKASSMGAAPMVPAQAWGGGACAGKGMAWGGGGAPMGAWSPMGAMAWAAPVMQAPMKGKAQGFGKGQAKGAAKGAAHGAGGMMTGVVKHFVPDKMFGFIECAAVGADVYFKSDVPMDAGTPVSFALNVTQDGKPQAQLGSVTPTAGENDEMVGTIKSYNAQNAWGFVDVPGSADVYFKAQELPPDMQSLGAEALVGQQVRFRVHVTPDGKMQLRGASRVGAARPSMPGKGVKRAIAPSLMKQEPQKRPKPSAAAASGDPCPCAVKSFNAMKGYGFLESLEHGDVYFQRKLLPAHLQDAPLLGFTGTVQVQYTPDGKAQAAALQLDE